MSVILICKVTCLHVFILVCVCDTGMYGRMSVCICGLLLVCICDAVMYGRMSACIYLSMCL